MGNFSRTYPMVPLLGAGYSVTSLCSHPATGHTSHLSHTFSLQERSKAETKTNFFTMFSSFFYSTTSFSANDVCFLLSQTSLDTGLSLFWSLFSLHWLSEVPPHPWLPQLSVTPKTHPTVPFQRCSGNETSLCESVQSHKHGAQHVLGTLWELNTCSLTSALSTNLAAVKLKPCVLPPVLQVSALTESKSGTFCPTKSVLCFLFTLLLNTHSE